LGLSEAVGKNKKTEVAIFNCSGFYSEVAASGKTGAQPREKIT
jgi:hypothetical protein